METEINIVEILKDKPQGTKLYSSACGKCKLEEVDDKSFKISFYNSKFGFMNGGEGHLDKNGKLYDDGECVVFPSKEMRDWRKFDWKKGDVLVNKDGDVYIIFERFVDDTYCSFLGKYYLWKENNDTEQFYEKERLLTSDFQKAGKDAAQTYINTIEERLGGKLNRETLEIEKSQPELKDGDIVFMKGIKDGYFANCIFILRSEYKDGDERAFYYAFYNTDDKFTIAEHGYTRVHYSLRPATDSEKQQLFDTLAKKGKTWDAKKKMIVDLKPKYEFKPMDLCLMKYIGQYNNRGWELCQYAYTEHRVSSSGEQRDFYHSVGGEIYAECIPYNEDTKHLLGTRDKWKGGE